MLKRRRDPAAVNSRLIRRPIQRMFWLFLLPMTGAFCIGFVYPFLKGLFLSFCKFKLTSQWTWVGFDNYVKAFSDSSFLHAFWYTALFALVSVAFINVLAFAVYGWDKARSKVQGARRVPEKTLFLLAILGGSVGAILGMRVWHHKTRHWYFKYGLPAILLAQLALAWYLGGLH